MDQLVRAGHGHP